MMSKLSSPKLPKSLEESKDSKDLNNPPPNRPSISAVKKLNRKFNPNNELINSNNNNDMNVNGENSLENKVLTFGRPNKNSVESNLTNKNNNKDIRDNDSYPENNLNDIKDKDAFPENHLHDIEDNDNYPENHGEDDFIYGNNNDINNQEEEEKYEDMEQDFNQYINNQSQNDKSQNMNENKSQNNNLPKDEPMPQNEEENTEPYDFNQENNNDLLMSNNNESKNDIKASLPNNNDIKDNDFPDNKNIPANNEQNQYQEKGDNLNNENDNMKMSNQIENENNNNINQMNESESEEIELNNFYKKETNSENNQNFQNDIKEEENINDHSEEIKDIAEELFVEEYNPSLGLTKINYPSFLNPVIQCFAHIPDITDKILNLHLDENFKDNLEKIKLSKNYRNLLINLFHPEKLYNMERKAFNPIKFRNIINELNPLFKENDRIELKEFINYFILKLHDELNTKKNSLMISEIDKNSNTMEIKKENDVLVEFLTNFTKKNNSIISKNLYGITKYTLYCHQCQNSIYNFQCYSHLYFNISSVLDYKIERYHREDIQLNLYDCLDFYQKSETLRGDKGIFCPSCKTQTESTSIKSIYSTKNVLIFILDRNIGNNFNQTLIDFDETLNLRDYVEYKKNGEKTREKFYLGGIINYYLGDDEMNGTYNAFIKIGKRGDWYCYEDENVYSVNFENIKNNGYPVVLFYHKLTKK